MLGNFLAGPESHTRVQQDYGPVSLDTETVQDDLIHVALPEEHLKPTA